ncbi:hypothetical protein [Streptomyces tirandamycinicus]|uniref:Lipoprotein n=1 Tax=Streptomyces tirandamycinicus TaxID=2174846 RepID=A0A2S1SXW5_9ACTN|nr:hypothetical protein [Streptomyces tirandamycinicus]AWI31252.1 hypothetical protein DDW44_22565 [Streptomyces tirandamycinicus]
MTPRRIARALPLVLAAVLAAGCTSSSSSEPAAGAPPAEPKSPAPTGVGPYPEPARPTPAPARSHARIQQPHGGIPSPAGIDQTDAGAVSRGALTALMTYDTITDDSRTEASIRTADAGWCTPAFAAQLRSATTHAGPGATWTSWTQHRAYTTVALTAADEAGRPADTPTTAYRQWIVAITPHGRDGWKGPAEEYTAFVELTRAQAGALWRLSSLSLQ